MKTRTKALLLALCAVLLVVTTVFTTLAFLTDTADVKNTFTVGNVQITLDEEDVDEYGEDSDPDSASRTEDGNAYKLIPGQKYTKDPTVTVAKGSEEAYVFVKITSNLPDDVIDYTVNTDWSSVDDQEGVYVYKEVVDAREAEKVLTAVFSEFTVNEDVTDQSLQSLNGVEAALTVNAYAIQAAGMDGAADAWENGNWQ